MSSDNKFITKEQNFVIQGKQITKNYNLTSSSKSKLTDFFLPQKNKNDNIFSALKDISFNINKGEVLGIIGRNGSGKSTLLEIVCGVLEPSTGIVKRKGRIAALLELGAGFNPDFTGRENIMFSAALLGLSKKEIIAKFSDIEKFADIGQFIDQPVKIYSSGMYARLAFAVSINVTPDILIIDEALAVGDEVFQRKCFAKIDEIKRNGTTILFVSHSGTSIINLCDRVILLHQGELLFDGEPKTGLYYLQKIGNSDETEINNTIREIKEGNIDIIENKRNKEFSDSELLEIALEESECIISEKKEEAYDYLKYKEFYDNNLVPNTSLSYDPKGAIIVSAQLMTADDISVNNIVNSRYYKFKVQFEFLNDCQGVRAYALIRTMEGIDLAGCAYPKLNSLGFSANKGNRITIDFQFKCMLNQGVYFCNFALQASDGSLHHRLVDALAFRVMPMSDSHVTGLVDLEYHPKVYCSTQFD